MEGTGDKNVADPLDSSGGPDRPSESPDISDSEGQEEGTDNRTETSPEEEGSAEAPSESGADSETDAETETVPEGETMAETEGETENVVSVEDAVKDAFDSYMGETGYTAETVAVDFTGIEGRLDDVNLKLEMICGVLLLFALAVVCRFVYRIFNMFF